MKPFNTLLRKELGLLFHDGRALAFMIGIPVVLFILLGYALSTDLRHIRVGIIAPERDAVITRIASGFEATDYFEFTGYLDRPDMADQLMRQGKIDAVLMFDTGFDRNLITGEGSPINVIVDAVNPVKTSSVTMYVMGAVQNILSASMPEGQAQSGIVSTNIHMLFNPQLKGHDNFIPGLIAILVMLTCVLMSAPVVVQWIAEKKKEPSILQSVTPSGILIAKTTPYFLLSCINMVILLLLAFILFGVPMTGNVIALIVISLLYVIVALSIGLMISALANNQVVALLIAGLILIVPTIMLSGMIFPVECMPATLLWISRIIPSSWCTFALRKVMLQGLSFGSIYPEITALVAMAILTYTIAIVKFKSRLKCIRVQ